MNRRTKLIERLALAWLNVDHAPPASGVARSARPARAPHRDTHANKSGDGCSNDARSASRLSCCSPCTQRPQTNDGMAVRGQRGAIPCPQQSRLSGIRSKAARRCCLGGLVAPLPTRPAASAATPSLLETVGAIDRPIAAGQERHLGLFAAARASSADHLPRAMPTASMRAVGFAGVALGLAPGPAVRAAGGWIVQPAAGIEPLLASGEGERLAAVAARERRISWRGVRSLLITDRPGWQADHSDPGFRGHEATTTQQRNVPTRLLCHVIPSHQVDGRKDHSRRCPQATSSAVLVSAVRQSAWAAAAV